MRWFFLMMLGFGVASAGAWYSLQDGGTATDALAPAEGSDAAAEHDAVEPAVADGESTKAGPADAEPRTMLGVVVPAREVYLAPARFSRVAEVDAMVGQWVEAGERLALMDTRADQRELAAAHAAAAAARAEARRHRVEAQRSRSALQRAEGLEGIVAEVELDDLRAQSAMAAADTKGASASASERSARAQQIATRIEDAEIVAPFAGVVARRYAEPGTTLAAGEPVVHLISERSLLRFAVPEADASGLQLGQSVTVHFDDLEPVHGVITSIAPEVDPTARIVMAEAQLDTLPEERLRAGTIGRVEPGWAEGNLLRE